MNPTKIDQYQDYHQILNRQQQLSSIPQYNEINKNTTISVASKNDEIYLQVPSYPINDSLSTVTPGDLINCFRKLNKQTINSLEDLVHYIHDVSISLGSPFVSVNNLHVSSIILTIRVKLYSVIIMIRKQIQFF